MVYSRHPPATYEPTWNPSGSTVYFDAPAMQRPLPGNAFVPSADEMPLLGNPMQEALAQRPFDSTGYSSQAMLHTQDGARGLNGTVRSRIGRSSSNASNQRRYILDLPNFERTPSNGAHSRTQTARLTTRSPPVAKPRTLLPRTEHSLAASTSAFAPTSLQVPSEGEMRSGFEMLRASRDEGTRQKTGLWDTMNTLSSNEPSDAAYTEFPTFHHPLVGVDEGRPHASRDRNGIHSIGEAEIRKWNVTQVIDWMLDAGIDETIIELFEVNDIAGDVLMDLQFDDLKAIGIKSFGKRHRVWTAILDLKGNESIDLYP
jgi:hypothetical protein